MCRNAKLYAYEQYLHGWFANGWLGEEHGIGSFTCHTGNRWSLVDYLLIGAKLKQNVKAFRIDKLMYFMNHCTVVCSFMFQCNNIEE